MNTSSTTTNPDFQATVQQALAATQRSEFDRADALLHSAMQLDPSSAIPYFLLGANAAQLHRNDEAEAAFMKCLQRAPDFAVARFQLGLLQLTNARAAVALITWEPLLALEETSYFKCFVQGFVQILAGDAPGAESRIREGLALNGDNAALNRDMEGVLQRLAQQVETSTETASAEPPSTAPPTANDQLANHFLVGAYRQQ